MVVELAWPITFNALQFALVTNAFDTTLFTIAISDAWVGVINLFLECIEYICQDSTVCGEPWDQRLDWVILRRCTDQVDQDIGDENT
jgi:hypothetical protein